MQHEELWSRIQLKVCAFCIDGDGHGNCRLHHSQECALKSYFPLIVEAVQNTESEKFDDYLTSLRSHVCHECKHQSDDGNCNLRTAVDCGLDRYYPLVIEAIEEVKYQKNMPN